jgi:hypothetical protein
MNQTIAVSRRNRLIKRVLRYTGVYNLEDLSQKSIEELESIQNSCLISLLVKREFKNRKQ